MIFKAILLRIRSWYFLFWISFTLLITFITLISIQLFVAPFVVMTAFDAPYTFGSCNEISTFRVIFYSLILATVISLITFIYSVIRSRQKGKKILCLSLISLLSGGVISIVSVFLFSSTLLKIEATSICNCESPATELDREIACDFLDKM